MFDKYLIVDDSLRADPGAAPDHVRGADLGDVLLGSAHEHADRKGAADLLHTGPPVPPGHPPEPRGREELADVGRRDVVPPVALPAKGEDGVRADLELAGHPSGEVHAQERVARVGHGIDHAPHERALLWPHGQVLAAERHDARVGLAVDPARDAVGLQAGADDEPVDAERLAPGHDEDPAGHPPDRGDSGRQPYVGTNGTGESVVSYWVPTGTNGSPVSNFDVLSYVKDAASKGHAGLSNNSYMIGLQTGFEVYSGSWTISSYTVNIQ